MYAGCGVPFGPPFSVISTRVLSGPSGVRRAEPLSPDLFCAFMLTFTLLPEDFLSPFFASCGSATPLAHAAVTNPRNHYCYTPHRPIPQQVAPPYPRPDSEEGQAQRK